MPKWMTSKSIKNSQKKMESRENKNKRPWLQCSYTRGNSNFECKSTLFVFFIFWKMLWRKELDWSREANGLVFLNVQAILNENMRELVFNFFWIASRFLYAKSMGNQTICYVLSRSLTLSLKRTLTNIFIFLIRGVIHRVSKTFLE